jgi:S-adenosylmethionine hydrolase
MKAVILCICPEVSIVDISHEIEKFNIRQAAFALACAAPYFPKGTIHVAVVDPGVGTKRRPILIQTRNAIYVGPDNGILTLATKNDKPIQIREITNKKFMLPQISNTFHGRDMFAPTAAHIANKTSIRKIGKKVQGIFSPDFAGITRGKSKVAGEIIHIDGFGNVITNIDTDSLKFANSHRVFVLRVKGKELRLRVRKNYVDIQRHQIAGIIGGHGFLEISMNQDNAAKMLGVRTGDAITLFLTAEKNHNIHG